MKAAGHISSDHLAEVLLHLDECGKTFADLLSIEIPVHTSELVTPCEHGLRCSKTRGLEGSGHDVLRVLRHVLAYGIIVVGESFVLRDVLVVESKTELQHVYQSYRVQNDGIHHYVRAVIRSCEDGT